MQKASTCVGLCEKMPTSQRAPSFVSGDEACLRKDAPGALRAQMLTGPLQDWLRALPLGSMGGLRLLVVRLAAAVCMSTLPALL